jgi:RNA polymerase sigma-70 factor (ECF subfamily)
LAPAGTLAGHLFGAVRFRALAALKHARVERRYQERVTREQNDDAVRGEPAPDLVVEHADLYAVAVRAAQALPSRARDVFLLRWNHGLSHAEIATRMGISVKGVEAQLTRALKTLRRLLGDS